MSRSHSDSVPTFRCHRTAHGRVPRGAPRGGPLHPTPVRILLGLVRITRLRPSPFWVTESFKCSREGCEMLEGMNVKIRVSQG